LKQHGEELRKRALENLAEKSIAIPFPELKQSFTPYFKTIYPFLA
jgi:hypothetical protein